MFTTYVSMNPFKVDDYTENSLTFSNTQECQLINTPGVKMTLLTSGATYRIILAVPVIHATDVIKIFIIYCS